MGEFTYPVAMADDVDVQREQEVLDALRVAYETAIQIALTHPDLDRGWRVIEGVRGIIESATTIRYKVLVRLFEVEDHSTTRVGDRTGLSKQRADQLIKAAKKAGIEPSEKK